MRHVEFERLHNVRDVGGYAGAGGRRVRWGRLYRADSLGKLDGADLARFRALGVRTVIDLRYPWEITRDGRAPHADGMAYHNLSVEHRPYDQAALGPSVDPARYLADRYLEVAHDGAAELRQALDVLAGGPGPTVVHCTSGKDRTGLLVALVLTLLGVSEDDVVADFALTELATPKLVADWWAKYPDNGPLWPGYGRAPAEIMRLFLAGLAAEHGSVDGYLSTVLDVDDTLVTALRENLLDSPR